MNRKQRRLEQKQKPLGALVGKLKSFEQTWKQTWNAFYLIDVHIWVLNKLFQEMLLGSLKYSENYLEWMKTKTDDTQPFTESPIDYQHYYKLGHKWKEAELLKATAKVQEEKAQELSRASLKDPFDVDKELKKVEESKEGDVNS